MRKTIAFLLILILLISFSGCFGKKRGETVAFQGKSFLKADLSDETLSWLTWYNGLSEAEQLAVDFIPFDLYELCGYGNAEDTPAETR